MDLKAFLEGEGLDTVYETLVKKRIKTLKALRNRWANDKTRAALVTAFRAVSADPEWQDDADAFEAMSLETIDEALAAEGASPAPVTTPEADAELKAFLKERGFDAQAVAIVALHGATTVAGFQVLCADEDLRKALRAKLLAANPLNPKLLDKIVADDIGEPVEPDDPAVDDAKNDPRRDALAKAIKQVEDARSAVAEEAGKDMASVQKRVADSLKDVLTIADSGKILERLQKGSFADLAGLDAALAAARDDMNDAIEKQILAAQKRVRNLPPRALSARLSLLRGFHMNASRVAEATGSDLLDMPARVTLGAFFDDTSFDFSSQSSHDRAESTAQRSSSSFATKNKASGAAFVGSGMAALSVAAGYATAKEQYEAEATALRQNTASRIRVRRIWQRKAEATLARDRMKLSAAATREIRRIGNATSDAARETLALRFLETFGSHVFQRVAVGGSFKVVATAHASGRDEIAKIDTAVSQAFDWNASLSTSYIGLGGAVSASSGNTGSGGSSKGKSGTKQQTHLQQEIKLETVVAGGAANLSLELWKASLEKNPFWVVLDRDEALAIWVILDDPGLPSLPEDEQERIAVARKALEKVWVQKIFVPSLEGINARLASLPAVREAGSCAELEREIRLATTPPALNLSPTYMPHMGPPCEFIKGGSAVMPPRKILSGGVVGVGPNLLMASYPVVMNGVWSWEVQMKSVGEVGLSKHEITLVVLDDPDDEWDVQIFQQGTSNLGTRHVAEAVVGDGYVLTGGGAAVDRFSASVLTGFGPYLDPNAPLENPAFTPAFRASSRAVTDEQHCLTAYAIGIKPRNLSLLKPRYRMKEFKAPVEGAQHHHHTLLTGSGRCVGGGAFVVDPGRTSGFGDSMPANYLTGSLPALDGTNTRLVGWSAASKDQGGVRAAADMIMVTIELVEN